MGRAKIVLLLLVLLFLAPGAAAHAYRLPDFPSRSIEINGAKIHYLEMGEGSPVILLHGALGNAHIFSKNIEPLSKKFHVVAVDLPGFGQSGRGAYRGTIEDDTLFLKAFVEKKNLQHLSLIGISMGGHVALNYALKYPTDVDKLILISTTGAAKRPNLLQEAGFVVLWHKNILESYLTPKKIRQIWDEQYQRDLAFRDAYFATRPEFHSPKGIKKFIRSFHPAVYDILHHSLRKQVSQINAPTLIVWGATDPYHQREEGEFLLKKMPHADMITLRCGHTVMVDMPEQFNELALGFLLSKKGESK